MRHFCPAGIHLWTFVRENQDRAVNPALCREEMVEEESGGVGRERVLGSTRTFLHQWH
jgi:hypothetical protein